MMVDKAKETDLKVDLRERIILTSLDAFRKNGIKSITMDDIAALLKISKRTLYEIFQDKETLLKECILYHQQYVQKALTQLVNESSDVLEVILKCYQGSIEMYNKVNKSFFEDIKKYPKVHEMIKKNKEKDNKVVIDFLKKGVDQGLFRKDINFEIIHFLLREQMDLLAVKALNEFPFLEVYESIMLTYLRGISTEKGIRELDEFMEEFRKKRSEENKYS
ncbi:TetR/AcrR family transcriptional regulator [Bacteroides sp. 519]|uniref:TetR/AcrR family transcriptional regulator n=1 Tax=Bacteroides sp. 519 TaxID=2302937 RepID=UPI001940386E|nr:TetR/AcrR family transcriptional regulator [Bacteroides sp. 519]